MFQYKRLGYVQSGIEFQSRHKQIISRVPWGISIALGHHFRIVALEQAKIYYLFVLYLFHYGIFAACPFAHGQCAFCFFFDGGSTVFLFFLFKWLLWLRIVLGWANGIWKNSFNVWVTSITFYSKKFIPGHSSINYLHWWRKCQFIICSRFHQWILIYFPNSSLK